MLIMASFLFHDMESVQNGFFIRLCSMYLEVECCLLCA